MSTGVIQWSTTAASNATADTAVNWAEGMAPSGVNDSGRAMMAAAAKWRDDISGILVTGGTGTAYTITSNQVIAANINGMTVQFTPGTTNTGTVTLAVDGQTARPLRFITGTELPAGVILSGSLYQATYRSATTEWLLHSFDARQWVVPLGSALPYFGTSAPNSAFVFPFGQAISRTTYATCFTLFGTTFGVGDGSTTFNIPDLRGRIVAGKDDMGGSAASRLTSTYFGTSAAALGAVGGAESNTLVAGNLPAYTPSGSVSTSISSVSVGYPVRQWGATGSLDNVRLSLSITGGADAGTLSNSSGSGSASSSFTGTATSGASTPFTNIQPTLISNYILRVI